MLYSCILLRFPLFSSVFRLHILSENATLNGDINQENDTVLFFCESLASERFLSYFFKSCQLYLYQSNLFFTKGLLRLHITKWFNIKMFVFISPSSLLYWFRNVQFLLKSWLQQVIHEPTSHFSTVENNSLSLNKQTFNV